MSLAKTLRGTFGLGTEIEKPRSERIHANAIGAYFTRDFYLTESRDDWWRWSTTSKALSEILGEWISFRFDTVTSHPFQTAKVDDRIHILEGRQTVLLNIDKVIKIIRESDEPKPALIAAFRLSDRQAEDILEIRLRQLARLEAIKIEQELAELRNEKRLCKTCSILRR